MPTWEYTTWQVADWGAKDAQVNTIDGESVGKDRRQRSYAMLNEAGAAGWEIVHMEKSGLFRTILFKRPKAEE